MNVDRMVQIAEAMYAIKRICEESNISMEFTENGVDLWVDEVGDITSVLDEYYKCYIEGGF